MKKFLLLIALIISGVGFVSAQYVGNNTIIDYDGYSLQFTVTSVEPAECELISYDGSPTDIIIPATVTFGETELEVTSIGNYAFSGCSSLTNISFGENSQLTSIVDGAFYGCSSLTSIEIPSGVTSIGGYAFYGCSSLTIIEIPSGVTSIGNGVFGDCYSLTGIEIPSGVTSIGDVAFYGCSSLTSIEIPSGVTEIPGRIFENCTSLKSIRLLAETVVSVGDNYLGNNIGALRQIQVPEELIESYKDTEPWSRYVITKIYPYHYGDSIVEEYEGYSLRFTADPLHEGAEVRLETAPENPTAITIPSTVTIEGMEFNVISIGGNAFRNCSSLTGIEIPSGVTSIGSSAFYVCSSLTNISFCEDSQLTSIGGSAFLGCYNLTSIEIPSGVTSIGSSAFRDCSSLTSIEIPSGVTSIGSSAFSGCSSLTSIEIPSGVTSIGSSAFWYCSNLTSIEIPSGVTSIGGSAFYGCSSLTSIEIPSGVTSIGGSAFSECSSLTNISFGENSQLTSIGGYAFYDCPSLTSIEIPSGVTSIGEFAFSDCSSLTSIEIPSGVTSIGFAAFSDCSSLTGIEIPSGVTSIGESVFSSCSRLTRVTFGEDSQLTSIEYEAFGYCSSLTSIEIPSGVTYIGVSAFNDCSSLTGIEIPSGVTSIEPYAFYGCSSLTSIEIPSGVTSIGSSAFGACSSLTSVNFAENSALTSVGGDAFTYAWNLKFVEFPATLKTLGENCFGELRYVICNSVSKPTTQGPLKDNDGELTIFVPGESVDAYKENFPWNGYEILPIDPASVNVTVNDEEAGSVVGAGDYCKSMEIRLLATPNRGYDFVGWKEDGEIVSTDSDYYFTLYGDRTLEAVFELSKYWHPDLHLYPNTMNMITEVKVDGELQNSTLLEVGAFCGDELRGSGRIQYNAAADKYIAYISVMGETDDQIKFRLFDHETYQELSHASLSVLPFETNAIVGTVTEPYLTEFSSTARVTVTVNPSDAGYVEGAGDYPIGSLVSLKATNYLPYLFESWTINGEVVGTTKTYNFVATESVNIKANFTCSQRTELSAGWNWTSFHTFIYGYNGLLALELSLGDYGLHIKNQNSFVTNHNGTWYGSLTSVDVEQMYIIRVSEDFTLVLNGLVVNPENYHITLTKNWKWIGYPVSVEMPVAEAFSGITPSEGDVVKTQGEFAMYNEGIGWSGNLTKMKPGKGYMYYNNSNSTKTLTYPTPSSGQSRSVETEDEITHWTADDTKYPSNMNMVAVLNVDGNELGANYEIAAFAGEELRGNARPIYIESLDRYMLFLTISGEETENLKFRCYNEETGEEFDITENIMFSMNAVVGSVDEPYVFNCNINDEAKDTAEIEVYPNPVNAGEEINLGMTYDKVEIYNAIGAKIAEYNNVNKLAQIEIAGVYVIKATIGGEVKYDRLIVQ